MISEFEVYLKSIRAHAHVGADTASNLTGCGR
jgi:hypothetical protein